MRPPKGVGAAARAAYTRAAADLAERGHERVVLQDQLDRYVFAVDMVDRLRKRWEASGRPLLSEGGATGKAEVPHPLVGMIANAERDAQRFAVALGFDPAAVKVQGGRPRGASSARDRKPAAKVVRLHG